jgi:hypothetical protein
MFTTMKECMIGAKLNGVDQAREWTPSFPALPTQS